jgi:hypothetical protein
MARLRMRNKTASLEGQSPTLPDGSGSAATTEMPVPAAGGPVSTPTEELPAPVLVAGIHPDDPDDEWIVPERGMSIRVGVVTGIIVLLGALAGGFWGGVVAEKHHASGSSSGTSALASALRSLRSGTGAGTGAGVRGTGTGGFFGGTGGAGGSATTGTVIGVQGDVIDISDSNGNIVKIAVPASATVTRTARTSPAGVQIGDTVVVSGTAGSNGTVTASSIRAVAQNAGSATGAAAFPGGGGAGG